jgi:hypothetical protein
MTEHANIDYFQSPTNRSLGLMRATFQMRSNECSIEMMMAKLLSDATDDRWRQAVDRISKSWQPIDCAAEPKSVADNIGHVSFLRTPGQAPHTGRGLFVCGFSRAVRLFV